MRLDKLELLNFRPFENLQVDFHPRLNVLVGENASGKTSILEGAAVAIGGLLALLPVQTQRHIQPDDVLQNLFEHEGLLVLEKQWPSRIVAHGQILEHSLKWSRALRTPRGRTTQANELKEIARQIEEDVRRGKPTSFPVLAYYGTQRVWLQKRSTEARRGIGSRFDGYVDALDPASNHRSFAEWMYQQTLVQLQQNRRSLQLVAIENAVSRCIPGCTNFMFNVRTQSLEVYFGKDELVPFGQLSDGFRNVVALVADIAWRASVLNPHLGDKAAELSEGLVLIDEVELHLHPRWQRSVLSDLTAAFPLVQFVVTTHSPQVLAECRRDEVRLLSRTGHLLSAPFVEGRDSNSLLEDVFQVPERPEEIQEPLLELARLIDSEQLDQARVLLFMLEAKLGPDDPAIIRARWELELEAIG